MHAAEGSGATFPGSRSSLKAPCGLVLFVVSVLALATDLAWPETLSATHPASALKKMSLEQLFDLEVTTVSRKPESLSKAAAAVHVVTQDDIRRSGAPSIPEALRYIPGVEVARVDSRQYAITARGFNGTVANKLLVLIDGRSVYTPLFSGVFWDAQDVFIDDIEQIEVIRGPGATIWGANAVNGVINVITKNAVQTQGLKAVGEGGSEESGFAGLRYGGALGSKGWFRIYGKLFERDASRRPVGVPAGDDLRMSQGGFRADWAPSSDVQFALQGDAYGGSIEQPSTSPTDLFGGNVLMKWARRLSPGSNLELQAYYDRTDRDVPTVFGEALDVYDVQLRHRIGAINRHDVAWGLEYRMTRDDVRNSAGLAFLPAHVNRHLITGFVQDELALIDDRLRLTLGSKFEHNDYTGFEYQPSARLLWAPAPDHTVWTAVSRAVRTPSRIDRDLFVPASAPYFLAGGPNFESEVLYACELGYKVIPTPVLMASLASFYNRYDKLRSLEMGSPTVLGNGLEGRTYGIEGEAGYQPRESWRLNVGYTFLRLDLERKPTSTDVAQLGQQGDSPRHQFFARSSWSFPHRVELDLAVRHVGELPNQQVPAYTTGDARIGWEPVRPIELSLVGRNLFDPHHPEFGTPASRRETERTVFGKVTCRL